MPAPETRSRDGKRVGTREPRRTTSQRTAQSAAAGVAYRTRLGKAVVADSLGVLKTLKAASVQLVLTSPPFALTRSKAYGNEPSSEYLAWLLPFAREVHRVLKADGSFVLDLGGSWVPGKPVRNVYQYDVLLALMRDSRSPFLLAQDFFWLNRARLPSPVQWVNVERIRVTDAVNVVWWLAKNERPYADNRSVLRPYSQSMLKLFDEGYNPGHRPSEWNIGRDSFFRNNGGSIPSNYLPEPEAGAADLGYPTNLLAGSNTSSQDPYLTACRGHRIRAHPARFPIQFAEFFVAMLTRDRDLVVDPFAGSNTTGWAAERKGRRWHSIDVSAEYLVPSAARFGIDPAPLLRKFGVKSDSRPQLDRPRSKPPGRRAEQLRAI